MSEQEESGRADSYRTSELGLMISRAIETHADEIRRAADAGDAPISVIGSLLYEHIDENIYWRLAEKMIAELLGPDFEAAGRKDVPIRTYRRGRYFKRRSAAL